MNAISLSDRKWLLAFEKGEELVESLTSWSEQVRLRGASLSAIGAFSRCELGFFVREENRYDSIGVREQVEVTSLLGSIGCDEEGSVRLHLHATVSNRSGEAMGGHLLGATVWPTVEMFVTPTGVNITRRLDDETGLQLLI